eukprot:6488417-Amphidinium_carterae.2
MGSVGANPAQHPESSHPSVEEQCGPLRFGTLLLSRAPWIVVMGFLRKRDNQSRCAQRCANFTPPWREATAPPLRPNGASCIRSRRVGIQQLQETLNFMRIQ